jgi:ribosome modulation factor
MSMECVECERDLRGGHAESCSRHPKNACARPSDAVHAGIWDEGYGARKAGLDRGKCPYLISDHLAAWRKGWYFADWELTRDE